FSLLVVKSGVTKVFESILDTTSTKTLLLKMQQAFANNAAALSKSTTYACRLGLLTGPTMTDVTGQVAITTRGFRKQRTTGSYVGRVRVKNTSATTISGPMIFTFAPEENVTLASSDGQTCAVRPW